MVERRQRGDKEEGGGWLLLEGDFERILREMRGGHLGAVEVSFDRSSTRLLERF